MLLTVVSQAAEVLPEIEYPPEKKDILYRRNQYKMSPGSCFTSLYIYGALEIAAIWAAVRLESDPMPPRLLLMADWIAVTELPFLPLPWHPLQYWV
jgi:hypothetical protein